MKKFFILFLCITLFCLSYSIFVFASASASVSVSSSSPQVGDTVSITFKLSGSEKIGAVTADFDFDSAKLQYVSCSGTNMGRFTSKLITDSRIRVFDVDMTVENPVASYSITLQFKTLAIGTAEVSLVDGLLENENGAIGSATATASVTIKAKPSPSLSSNCNLSALKVPQGCTLSPAFSSNVTQYTCTVPYSVTSFPIEPTRSDSKSSIEFIGKVSLDVGKNTRSVRVTAEDGTTKTYTITITRQAEGTTEPTPTPPADQPTAPPEMPLTVTVDGKNFTLEEQITKELPAGFALEEYTYSGRTIQTAVLSEVRLVLLSDETDSYFYILNEADRTFAPFQTLTSSVQTVYTVLTSGTQALPLSWRAAVLEVDGISYSAWQSDVLGEGYYIISTMNNATGEKYLCVYCTEDGTIQKLSPALLEEKRLLQATGQPPVVKQLHFDWRKAALAAAVVILAAVIIAIVVLFVKKKKLQQPAAVHHWGTAPSWQDPPAEEEDTIELFEVSETKKASDGKKQDAVPEQSSQDDDGDFT